MWQMAIVPPDHSSAVSVVPMPSTAGLAMIISCSRVLAAATAEASSASMSPPGGSESSFAIEAMVSRLKLDRETAEGVYQLSINNFSKDGTMDDAALKVIVDQQLAEAKVKEVPLSQVADFNLLRQVLKETPSPQ